jgi:hypothetical protein
LLRVTQWPPTLLLWLQTLGLVALCLPGRRIFLLLVLLFHAPVLFLASMEEFDWRLLTVALAAFQIGAGAAAQTIANALPRLRILMGGAGSPARPGPDLRRTKKPGTPDYRR